LTKHITDKPFISVTTHKDHVVCMPVWGTLHEANADNEHKKGTENKSRIRLN